MAQFQIQFPSDPAIWTHVRLLLKDVLEIHHIPSRESNLIALAVDEAFTNVHRHAYGESTDCPVELRVKCACGYLTVELQDYGKKCDPTRIKSRDLNEIRPGGLGVHIIKSVFEDVIYDTSNEKGTNLLMRKRLGSFECC